MLPTRIITYAWGDRYVDDLLSFTVPALLAPDNLPYVASQVPCEVVILTEQRHFTTAHASDVVRRIREFCPVRLVALDDLISAPDKYGMALTYTLHRGFSDLGDAATDTWLMFLNADFVLANGSLRNVLSYLRRGERIVASPSYCVNAREVIPELRKATDDKTSTLSLEPREMAKLALDHLHNTVRGKIVNQSEFHIFYTDQFYWQVDADTLLAHQLPFAIVGMRPEKNLTEPNSFWDHGLIQEFCPTAPIAVIDDSDEFLMIELREKEVAKEQIVPGPANPRELGERMIAWSTPYQRDFSRYQLTLHAKELPAGVDEARQKLAAHVDEAVSHVPAFLPSHIGHPQWNYHWPAYAEARFAHLSEHLGSRTEADPPASLSESERVWWRLDGAKKIYQRRRQALQEAKEREIVALREAFGASRAGADRQAIFETTVLSSAPSPALIENQRALNLIPERYQEKSRQLEHEFAAILAKAQADYDRVIARRTSSAMTPFVRLRRGHGHEEPTSSSSRIRSVAGRAYRKFWGSWPRVGRMSPWWASTRRLAQIVDDLVAGGAQNILFVGNTATLSNLVPSTPGVHAWVSLVGVQSGNLRKAFDPATQFDVCVCDIGFAEMTRLQDVYSELKPLVRPGGTIVGFHLNADGRALPPEHDRLSETQAEIFYAGSWMTWQVLRAFRRGLPAVGARWRQLRLLLCLGALGPPAWIANWMEEWTGNEAQSRQRCTSITTVMTVPAADLEGTEPYVPRKPL